MKVSLLALPVLIVGLLLIGGLIVVASRKGFGSQVILAISMLASGALAYAGLRFLFDSSDANDLRGLIISLAGVAAIVTSGIVYAKVLQTKEPERQT